MKALILGAGYGVRLYPLTKNIPKALLPMGGIPIIERILKKVLPLKGLDKIYIVTNQRFYRNYEHWLSTYPARKKITLCDDGTTSNDDRLGAIGDIQFILEKYNIKDNLLIIAGDNLFDFNLSDFVRFFTKYGSTVALKNMQGRDKKLISQYSIVTLDKDKRIIDFEEKPPEPQGALIAICLYLFTIKELGMIKQYLRMGCNPDAPGYYIQWLYKKSPLYGCILKGKWFDIGDIDSYNQANNYYS